MATARAGARIFNAVPVIVWSALNLIAAKASSIEYKNPLIALTNITIKQAKKFGIELGITLEIKAPVKAPIVIHPSRPKLITPLLSENIPPYATKVKIDAYIKVKAIIDNVKIMLFALLQHFELHHHLK